MKMEFVAGALALAFFATLTSAQPAINTVGETSGALDSDYNTL